MRIWTRMIWQTPMANPLLSSTLFLLLYLVTLLFQGGQTHYSINSMEANPFSTFGWIIYPFIRCQWYNQRDCLVYFAPVSYFPARYHFRQYTELFRSPLMAPWSHTSLIKHTAIVELWLRSEKKSDRLCNGDVSKLRRIVFPRGTALAWDSCHIYGVWLWEFSLWQFFKSIMTIILFSLIFVFTYSDD